MSCCKKYSRRLRESDIEPCKATVNSSRCIQIEQYKVMASNLEQGFDIRNKINRLYLLINSSFIGLGGYLLSSKLIDGDKTLALYISIPLSIFICFISVIWLWQITAYIRAERGRFYALLCLEQRLDLDGYCYEERFFEHLYTERQHPYFQIEIIEKTVCWVFIVPSFIWTFFAIAYSAWT